MTDNKYYIHFKVTPPQEVIDVLTSESLIIRQVYESSYEFVSNLSPSEIRHLMRSFKPIPEHYMGKFKNGYNTGPKDSLE